MEQREKTDFILEQVRLCLAKNDFSRAQIIARKINTRFFKGIEHQDLKLRYYDLIIQCTMQSGEYLETCKHYMQVYDTPLVKEDPEKWKTVMQFL